MKKKKIVIVLIFICLFILVLDFLYGYFQASISSLDISNMSYDFYKVEHYYTPNLYLSFSKYYYHEEFGKIKIDSMNYKMVEDNVEIVKENIGFSLNTLRELENPIDIEFNYEIITPDDYYSISSNVEYVLLHYYDTEENILYITTFPDKKENEVLRK